MLLNTSFSVLFIICEFGERVRLAFGEVNATVDELKWYLLPRKTRKMLLTVLIVVQEPVGLTIFGSIICNRIIFKEVNLIKLINNALAIYT